MPTKQTFDKKLLTTSKQSKNIACFEFVTQVVCKYYKQDHTDIANNIRKREWVKTRQVVFYIIKNITNVSSNQIAKHFKLNHATILHALKVIKGYMSWDKDISKEVNDIIASIKPKSSAILSGYDIDTDFYFIQLDNFISIKNGNKAIILTGFTDDEASQFIKANGIKQTPIKHDDTTLYILEDRMKKLR